MKRTLKNTIWVIALALLAWGCGKNSISTSATDLPTERNESGKFDASIDAAFLVFEFDGELKTNSSWGLSSQIENQLLYTVGQLNGEKSVSRLDRVALTNVKLSGSGSERKITYHAKLIVAWGKRNSIPASYTFKLPKDVTYSGVERFTELYKSTCVDAGAHDVDANSMWYYYRPNRSGCNLADENVVNAVATVTLSEITTTGKYPEYHKIWEDGVFRTVAIFGKVEDGATDGDSGIYAYNRFVKAMRTKLSPYNVTTVPASLSSSPGVGTPDVSFSATLPDGKKVEVVALLIDGVRTAGADFDKRYASLTGKADFISYSGHSGLGANIRALARKGKWEAGQYSVVFMNGCDTYAYVDSALADARSAVNPDDPTGTKHLDMIMNAMPSYFSKMDSNTLAIFTALLAFDKPKTFEQIFAGIDRSQVVLVSGEQDNVYYPGYTGGDPEQPEPWSGLNESGTVAKNANINYSTPVLEPGKYLFKLSGTGDADLYVRVGEAPTTSLYDCRPYRWGSKESCSVEITTPTKVFVMVRGWDPSSDFSLVGSRQ